MIEKTSFLPLLLILLAVPFLRESMPPWAFMWIYAFSIFAGFKWLSYQGAVASGMKPTPFRSLAYLFLWPGMNAKTFLDSWRKPNKPQATSWLLAALTTSLGAFLLWGIAPRIPQSNPLLLGWVGLFGLILLLHFGSFHLIALAWQSMGIEATPIMRSPLLANSLADFWSNRWNLGFRQLTHDFMFTPLQRSVGARLATFTSFLVSGIIHELIISFPARGGYGLPTSYFALQGIGVFLERSPFGKHLGLGHGPLGRIYTIVMTGGPLFWLFHPFFIIRVMLPFMRVIGAN